MKNYFDRIKFVLNGFNRWNFKYWYWWVYVLHKVGISSKLVIFVSRKQQNETLRMISDAIAFESAQMSVMSIRLRKNENNNNNNQIQNSHSESAFDTLSGLKTQIKHVQTLILKIICNTVMSTNGGFKHFGSLLQLARLSFLTNPPSFLWQRFTSKVSTKMLIQRSGE